MQVLIATDSRGRGLREFVATRSATHPYNLHFDFVIMPGGTINSIGNAICEKLDRYHLRQPTMVVFAGGINNLTTRIQHTHGTQITYPTQTPKAQHIITELQALHTHLINTYHVKIKFTTIAPASLNKNSDFQKSKNRLTKDIDTPYDMDTQQRNLHDDITTINSAIFQMNTGCGMLSVNWAKDLIRWSTKSRPNGGGRSIKVRKYSYVKLYDGVHPCDVLKARWFKILFESVLSDLHHLESINTDSDKEYDECETWDFKRNSKRYVPL